MQNDSKTISIPIWLIWVILIVLVALGLWFSLDDITDDKWRTVATGVISGLVVWLMTFVTQVQPLKKLQEFQATGFIALREGRYDEDYYSDLLKKARSRVDVTGTSGTKFLNDFLDKEANRHILLDAMRNNAALRVRLLVPNSENMTENSRNKFEAATRVLESVKKDFSKQFQVRYFDRPASHSFVLTDNDFIGGPVFFYAQSKDSPALHIIAAANYAIKHQVYFDRLWGEGTDEFDS